MERYFAVYPSTDEERINTVVMGLEGRALNWWQWTTQRHPITSWAELKHLMLRHFRPREGGSLCEQWMTIYQDGSVEDYCEKFIALASPLQNVSEEVMLTSFMKGLQPFIRYELRLWAPSTIEMAIDWATMIEEKHLACTTFQHVGPPPLSLILPHVPTPNPIPLFLNLPLSTKILPTITHKIPLPTT